MEKELEEKKEIQWHTSYELFNQSQDMIVAFCNQDSVSGGGKIQDKFRIQN